MSLRTSSEHRREGMNFESDMMGLGTSFAAARRMVQNMSFALGTGCMREQAVYELLQLYPCFTAGGALGRGRRKLEGWMSLNATIFALIFKLSEQSKALGRLRSARSD